MICRILLEQDYGLNLALSKDDILLCGYKLLASLLFHILTVRKNKIYSYSQLMAHEFWNLEPFLKQSTNYMYANISENMNTTT